MAERHAPHQERHADEVPRVQGNAQPTLAVEIAWRLREPQGAGQGSFRGGKSVALPIRRPWRTGHVRTAFSTRQIARHRGIARIRRRSLGLTSHRPAFSLLPTRGPSVPEIGAGPPGVRVRPARRDSFTGVSGDGMGARSNPGLRT